MENMFEKLIAKYPNIDFYSSRDFSRLYKKVDIDTTEVIKVSEKIAIGDNNQYIRDDLDCHSTDFFSKVGESVFLEMPIQFGWCFGKGKKLNGLEWHKSSEVVVACNNCVLFLADYYDIIDDSISSEKVIALYVEKGEAIELMPLTLHLAPINIENGFCVAIILPEGTNAPLEKGINGTSRAKNKWLLVHKENTVGISLGGKIGVTGDNLSLED